MFFTNLKWEFQLSSELLLNNGMGIKDKEIQYYRGTLRRRWSSSLKNDHIKFICIYIIYIIWYIYIIHINIIYIYICSVQIIFWNSFCNKYAEHSEAFSSLQAKAFFKNCEVFLACYNVILRISNSYANNSM